MTYCSLNDSEAGFVDTTSVGHREENWCVFVETAAVEPFLTRLSILNAARQRTQRFSTCHEPDRSGGNDRTEHRRTRVPM